MKIKMCTKHMVELLSWAAGRTCYKYIIFLFEQNDHSEADLNTLFEIFSKRYYSADILDAACFTSLVENVTTVNEFEELLVEVNASFRDFG